MLRDIVFGGRRHFRELLANNDEGIASNILANRLRKLVDEELLTRADASRGQRAAYSLTEAGIQTVPIMVALGAWGMTHRDTTPELTVRARIMAEDPQLVHELMDELRERHLGNPHHAAGGSRASERLRQAYLTELRSRGNAMSGRIAHR